MRTNAPANAVKKERIPVFKGKLNSKEWDLWFTCSTAMLFEEQTKVAGDDGCVRPAHEVAAALVPQCDPEFVVGLAIHLKEKMLLRHMPLYLVRQLVLHPKIKDGAYRGLVRFALSKVIRRVDELAEFLALYWNGGKTPVAAQVKLGIRDAFASFDEYSLRKYLGKGSPIQLRDVMFLVHPKPREAEKELYKSIADNTAKAPDTWEARLSSGEDKKEVFMDLLGKGKLGGLAFLRNLRNMEQAGVTKEFIRSTIDKVNFSRVLPYRFVSAVRYTPAWGDLLEAKMMEAVAELPKLPGKTLVFIDVSGSMDSRLNSKSDITRIEVACSLAILTKELCEDVSVYASSTTTELVPSYYRGLGLKDRLVETCRNSLLGCRGIYTAKMLKAAGAEHVWRNEGTLSVCADRVIIFTDCDDHGESSGKDAPILAKETYVINVAGNDCTYAKGKFNVIGGWSENVLDYIQVHESKEIPFGLPVKSELGWGF